MLCESITPASARSHSASNPTSPVVTSPSIVTPSSSASNAPVATCPHAVKAGPSPCVPSPPLERWNALPSRRSSAVMVRSSASSLRSFAHSGSPNGSSSSASGSRPDAPMTGMPATVTCEPPAPSSLALSASTSCDPTVRPKRTIHAFGIGSWLLIVPIPSSSLSFTREGDGFSSLSFMVSDPSSWPSSRIGTGTIFERSPRANVSVPEVWV